MMREMGFIMAVALGVPIAHAQMPPQDLAPIVTATNRFGTLESSLVTENTSPTTENTALAPENASPEMQATPAAVGPRFICRGTDPFWTLKIEQSRISFDLAGSAVIDFSQPLATSSVNTTAAVTNFTGTAQDGATLNALVIDARLNGGVSCSDGMSEEEYSYSAFINRGGQIYDGCCWMER